MKYTRIYIALLTVFIGVLTSCSTQKNTWATRNYHQMKTKYNIYFNGQVAFDEGEKAIRDANEDDYSTIINLYPVSNHKAAEAAASQMDKTIEKCRKCIKLHSIKARPKIDYKKQKDPKYQAWLHQEEFNNQMGNAWLMLGMAEFHKGDFLGSVSTFNYIARHYATDKDMVARCQLWTARAYAEMGWLYEAEDVLSKVQVDNLSNKHASLYSAVSADILLKTKQYKEAVPFIKIAMKDEDRKGNRPRFQFVLGQIYQMQGNRAEARDAYTKVLKMQPSNEMDFNARLRRAQLEDNLSAALKELTKMARQDKNKDKLDQIYGAIGNVYLARKDTVKSLQNYELAIEKSTQNGLNKASVLITAGDIYYSQRNYIKAGPCYKEATRIISAESEQYARIQRLSETLDELVVEYNTVQLQDSLQRLAMLTPDEQRVVVDSIIARLIRAEEEEKLRAEQAAREAENDGGPRSVNTSNMIGNSAANASWYFYNPQLIRSGKQTFRTQWGNRSLEDNWRRLSKTTTSSFMDTDSSNEDEEDALFPDSIGTDTTKTVAPPPIETDNHKPEYYLQQIPKTDEDFHQSNLLIANALYNMVYIYRDKVGDRAMSDETFREFCRRFPRDERLLDLYYMQYLTALKEHRDDDAEQYKQDILTLFPESNEAMIVSQPDYFDRLRHMAIEQDSLYEATYKDYTQSNFAAVKANKLYAEEHYPLTPLMPRFLFLNAIAVAKTDGQDAFILQLQDMVARYPESELGAMAKNMLAMMGQGMESQTGGTMASLQDRRATEQTEESVQDTVVQFDTDRMQPSLVVLVIPQDEKQLNQLLYRVALFNFTQFMIKDFDLKTIPAFAQGQSALQILGFESMDEAEWYSGLLSKNPDFIDIFSAENTQPVSITTANFRLLNTHFSIDDYRTWLAEQEHPNK